MHYDVAVDFVHTGCCPDQLNHGSRFTSTVELSSTENNESNEIHSIASGRGLEGVCDSKQTKKCDKMAWQKIGEPLELADFLSLLLWSFVRLDKILSRRKTPVALVYSTRWQFFLQSKQKFCLVRPAPLVVPSPCETEPYHKCTYVSIKMYKYIKQTMSRAIKSMSSVSLFWKWKCPVAVSPKPRRSQSRVRKQNNCHSFSSKRVSSRIPVEQVLFVSSYTVSIKLGLQRIDWV